MTFFKSPLNQLALAISCSLSLMTVAWPAAAQINPAALAALQGQGTAGSSAGAGSMGIGAVPGLPGVTELGAPQRGLMQLPGSSARPDAGAADAPRTALTPLQAPKLQTPSQFQRFVQEGTGKLLPHFGANLFDNPLAYAADAATPAPAEYVLGPGDEVRIQIWGATDFVGNQTLDRNGQISLPKIGTVNLSGVQVKNLETTLRKQVGTVFTNVQLSASLGKLRGITVYVVGQAQQPGTYNLSSLSTLINAIFASGGPSPNGSMRAIELKRAGQTVTTIDLYNFISKGDKTRDAALQPGDVIMIPPVGPRVALTGATDHGAIYELKSGTSVKDILNLGGGIPMLASQQKALLERIDTAQPSAVRQVQSLVLNEQGSAQILRDGDVLTLLPISPAFGNAVTLQGAVAQPLRHAWFSGMRISDLIPDREALISPDFYKRRNQLVQNRITSLKAQGFTPEQIQSLERANHLPDDIELTTEIIARKPYHQQQARDPVARVRGFADPINWDYAVIQRLNKAELKTELIPFNLAKAVLQKDPKHNLILQADDVVTVMNSADLRLPVERQTRLVRLEGEVVAPGVYQASPGETLPQLIERAGGLTAQAYVYGAEFTRETVRKVQQQNLDQVVRRLESQMQSAGATLAANLTGERAAQAQALQQQQQQQMQSQISRLKSLQSKGRVALALDPEKTALTGQDAQALQQMLKTLPPLPLEDGDALMVPSLPSFVAAAGSVNNENVFVYRKGKTVGDIIKSAGLTEDAEPKEAFVLRADGSIVSRRSTGGWFSSFESTAVMPGDTLVVPAKVDRESNYNFIVRGLRDWTQIFSNLGIGAAAIQSLKN